ncbi:aromatic motif membrane protein [Metamycoplasma gateae]|uniref:Aromatic motif membrane protein n=1 Tax=Metamycoplasma gateae TaxID=35769 RepID=A0ABZ2AIB3_9BACT|nr:aromatic motif membrane protein [Metamycoplasma gateae]
MKKISRLILPISIISTSFIPFSLISCIKNEDNNSLKSKIPTEFDFVPNVNNPDEIKTNKLIEELINLKFKNDEVNKTLFLESQKNEDQIYEEIKTLTKNYLKSKSKENIDAIKLFYSNNWLFIIKNISKFKLIFTNWWTFEPTANARHTEGFFERLDKNSEPKDLVFFDNNWDQLKEGDESPESPDDVYYFKKGKLLLRILISKNNQNKRILNFEKIILFSKSKTNKVSIKLVSDAVHNAVIHKMQVGYDAFENEVIDNFGFPSLGLLILKEV